jgi:serine/threonine-protein phosphatase 6 regulatory subunit 3
MMHALNVCIALVEPLPPSPAEQQAAAQGLGLGALPVPAIDATAAELHAAMRGQAIQCMSKSIDRLVALLEAVDGSRKLPTSYGLLQPPVGLARLKAVELLAALLHSGDEAAGALWASGLACPLILLRAEMLLDTVCP